MYLPEPDILFRPSAELEKMMFFGTMPPKADAAMRSFVLDPSIKDIEMRLKEVFVFDVRDWGKGDIYLVTVVADDLSEKPVTLEVKTFKDIKKNEALTLGPTGVATYRNPAGKIPRFLDYRFLVMESDQELRDAADVLKDVQGNDQFKSVVEKLALMAAGGNPIGALITPAADLVIGIISGILKINRDDQLMYLVGSFSARFDDLGVPLGVVSQKNRYCRVAYQVLAG